MSKPKTSAKKKDEATPKRDNFPMKTALKLRDSAGNVCTYPGCHVHTHGAKSNGEGALGIGVACHIKAAAPGGPRYDVNQTPDQRRHFDNGIWMCQTHSKLIDADDSAYSVATLLQWKRDAEARSNALLNKKSFTEKEVNKAVDAGAVSMLQRWVNQSGDPLNTPIVEIMKGYESNLNDLDPRFVIEVNKVGNTYTHVIQAAKNDVNINLVLQNLDQIDGFWNAKQAFVEEGKELLIPAKHFEIRGSKLFDAIRQTIGWSQGVLSIGRVKKSIAANLYLRTEKGQEVFIESFTCHYTSGTVCTVFEGTALDGFISVKALCSHEGESHKFDLTFNVEAWKGKNLLELPRFSRLLKAAKLMAEGRLVFEFEVGSDAAAFDSTVSAGTENFHELLQWIIFYLDVARKIAERCHEPIFLKEVDFDYDLYVGLKKYAKLFPGPIYTHRTPGMLCEGSFDYNEGFTLDSFGANGFPNSVKLLQQGDVMIKLLGTSIRAPRIESSYTNINTIFSSDIEDRGKPRLEIHTTPATHIMIQIHPEDAWVVLDEQEAPLQPTVTD